MNLSLRQLRAFLAIARLQSFTRAAEQMHISQAGLSSMLRDVEAQLGCRLFDRTTRQVSLTDQGRMLLPVAASVVSELETARASLDLLSATESRTLVVGATPLVASCVLPAVCAAFARERPLVTVTVRDLGRGAIEDCVRSGEVEVGFGVFLDEASGLQRVALIKTPLVLVAAAGCTFAATRSRLRWSDLRDVPLIGLPPRNPIQQCVDAELARIGRANESRFVFNYLHTILAMTETGAACAILPSFVASASARYRLRLIPLGRPRIDLEFFAVTRSGRPRSPAVASFSACLRRALAPAPRGSAARHGTMASHGSDRTRHR